MQSPDLDPRLAEGLLTSLANWDFTASVPLAHLFMECGDLGAQQQFDDMALNDPIAQQMLNDRYLAPSPDLDYLGSLPQGSLGESYAQFVLEDDLDPELLRVSAFI